MLLTVVLQSKVRARSKAGGVAAAVSARRLGEISFSVSYELWIQGPDSWKKNNDGAVSNFLSVYV
jgi:hypothetical protein